jgi:hypothetical protein
MAENKDNNAEVVGGGLRVKPPDDGAEEECIQCDPDGRFGCDRVMTRTMANKFKSCCRTCATCKKTGQNRQIFPVIHGPSCDAVQKSHHKRNKLARELDADRPMHGVRLPAAVEMGAPRRAGDHAGNEDRFKGGNGFKQPFALGDEESMALRILEDAQAKVGDDPELQAALLISAKEAEEKLKLKEEHNQLDPMAGMIAPVRGPGGGQGAHNVEENENAKVNKNSFLCKLCGDEQATIVLVPCAHAYLCLECAKSEICFAASYPGSNQGSVKDSTTCQVCTRSVSSAICVRHT